VFSVYEYSFHLTLRSSFPTFNNDPHKVGKDKVMLWVTASSDSAAEMITGMRERVVFASGIDGSREKGKTGKTEVCARRTELG